MERSNPMARDEFRPATGRLVSGGMLVLCAVGLVGVTREDGWQDGLRWAPFLALVAGLGWAMFWHPRVVVDFEGVTMVNVVRTITVPWPAIVEVDTRWGLTLVTVSGRYRAWAAPAPGAAHVLRHSPRHEGRHLPATTYRQGTVRPGDLPSSASGGAALIVRTWWEQLQRQGALEEPRLEFASIPVRWHARTLLVLTCLVAACSLSVIL